MIKDLLTRLGGIETYGMVSLFLFFLVFVGMLIWVFLLRKPFLNRMARMPLDDESEPLSNESLRHE
jgi:cbb3-type cytochrome oxidase subunit 3